MSMVEHYRDLLDELWNLVCKQYEDVSLTEQEEKRYVEIVNILRTENIEIPFGIEI
jgi:ureidoglycolate hydrolase